MRARLLLVAAVAAGLAGCATASTSVPAGGQASSTAATTVPSATASSTSRSAAATTSPAGTPSPSSLTGSPGAWCASPTSPFLDTNQLTGVEFVSPSQGWAVGQGAILATTDGGADWAPQLTGRLDLTAVDFVNASDGWAVGTDTLLATTDGGAHWTPLSEPCPLIRSVHFTSALDGYAVAGGKVPRAGGFGTEIPDMGGVVLVTHDGGHIWGMMAAPANAQTVCFGSAQDGWLGAGGRLFRTRDGGRYWTPLTAPEAGAHGSVSASMSVECAGRDAVWAVRSSYGGGMNQQPHVAYHADAAGLTGIYAEGQFRSPGDPATSSPGGYAGPFSALSSQASVFIDSCGPCDGFGSAPWAVAANAGATLTEEGNVGGLSIADAAAFLSPQAGWVAGTYNQEINPARSRAQQRIVMTSDGGKTWRTEWASPWVTPRR
ncbi:MAG TPA: YCF48-related protein [Trebonia sp.]|nr:YCF48-related protein [Trebonia sp.]